jgi:UDP-N-acetylenolpyruvoylglucosamine reductase
MKNFNSEEQKHPEKSVEAVRKRVYENSGIRLRWEIKRIGEK